MSRNLVTINVLAGQAIVRFLNKWGVGRGGGVVPRMGLCWRLLKGKAVNNQVGQAFAVMIQ